MPKWMGTYYMHPESKWRKLVFCNQVKLKIPYLHFLSKPLLLCLIRFFAVGFGVFIFTLYLYLYVLYFIYPSILNNNVGSNMMQPKSSEEEEEMLEQNMAIPFKNGIQDQSPPGQSLSSLPVTHIFKNIQWQDCRR